MIINIPKPLLKFLCCFIPSKKIRNNIRSLRHLYTKTQDEVAYEHRKASLEKNNTPLTNEMLSLLLAKDNAFSNNETSFTISNINFFRPSALYGLAEIFGRRDYEFGGLKNCIFIDVGTNIGDSALYAANCKHIDKIYAYEPFPETYALAKANIELNPHLSNKIELHSDAWSNKNEKVNIKVIDDSNMKSVNSISNFFVEKIETSRSTSIDICVKKSSDILKEIIKNHPNQPIVLKMDIEGAEYECFEDLSKNDMLKHINMILVEWHFKGYQSIIDILEKNNFVWFNEKFFPEVGFIRAYRTH